jgi:DNA-binding response OmpR family regulator
VKVLFMSGYTADVLARLDPATEFIAKPFTPATLVERVSSVLRSHRADRSSRPPSAGFMHAHINGQSEPVRRATLIAVLVDTPPLSA